MFQHADVATQCGISRSDLALAQGAVAGGIPSTRPELVVYESTPRFPRAICDSNQSIHYAQYLGGSASEASLRYRGSKTHGSPTPSNSVHRHPPDILKRLTLKDMGKLRTGAAKAYRFLPGAKAKGVHVFVLLKR